MAIKFSVVIPLFNKEAYVLDTLKSVFNQTYSDYEIIVVDDSSTDNSLKLVEHLNDNRIRIIKHKKNQGLSATRNTGIANARNDHIAFLDADDLWNEDYLVKISKLINTNSKSYVFGTYYNEIYQKRVVNPVIGISSDYLGKSWIVDDFFIVNMRELIITQSSLVVHKDIFKQIEVYDENVTFAEDIDFYIRCFSLFDLVYLYEPCVLIRKNIAESLTGKNTSDKNYPKLERYIGRSISLDNFINFYHYCICRRKKNEGDHEIMVEYRNKLKLSSIGFIKFILIYLPQPIYIFLLKIKKVLSALGLNLTSY
jgi:glycosyltransferase involved in cell wall biosynthesis